MAQDDAFKATTEGVSAKLEVEIPEKAITTLTSLAKQQEAYRISLEATTRAQGDHKDYLEKMPVIADMAAQKLGEWCDQVERAIDLKGKLGDFAGIPGAVGQDSANPFGPSTLGRGDLAHLMSDPSRMVSMGAQRGLVNNDEVGLMSDAQIAKLAEALAGAIGGGGGGGGGSDQPSRRSRREEEPEDDQGLSPRALEEQAMHGRDLFGQVLGEVGPGSSLGDMVGAGRDLLGRMEGAGGMLGRLGGALAPAGAAVGLALTANQLLQMGGERIQDYRNLGGTTGGGVSEGMQYDAAAKMMALDPFITTAQAREVIQGALNGGMGGPDQFDSVTGFIAKNLKDMNMQVADSVKLLQENVESGGMSIDQLGQSLANVRAMASGSAQSQGEIAGAFGSITSQLTGMGVSGQQGDIATQFIGSFTDSPLLAPVSAQLGAALANPQFASAVANQATQAGVPGLQGMTPKVAMQKLAKNGQLHEQTLRVLQTYARQAQAQYPQDEDMAVEAFFIRCQQMGLAIENNAARELYRQMVSPTGLQDALKKGNDATQAANKPIDTSFGDASMSGLTTLGSHIGNFLGSSYEGVKNIVTFDWGNMDETFDAAQKRKGEIDRQHEADAGMYTTESLKRAVAEYGADNLKVYDSQGKNPRALDQANKEQRDKLISGELLIAAPNQQPTSLAKFGSGQAAAAAVGAQNVQVTAQPITVRYEGPITGPQAVPLTANQMRANAGFGGATDNNSPPGDR